MKPSTSCGLGRRRLAGTKALRVKSLSFTLAASASFCSCSSGICASESSSMPGGATRPHERAQPQSASWFARPQLPTMACEKALRPRRHLPVERPPFAREMFSSPTVVRKPFSNWRTRLMGTSHGRRSGACGMTRASPEASTWTRMPAAERGGAVSGSSGSSKPERRGRGSEVAGTYMMAPCMARPSSM